MLIAADALLIHYLLIVTQQQWPANYGGNSMGKLCERPGCSELAALAYGMRTEDLVFWIDVLRGTSSTQSGVLCQRHGDSMTVPRGWTLDDLRDPDLHLFRPPPRPEGPATRRNRSRRRSGDDTGQLELGGIVDTIDELEPEVDDRQAVDASVPAMHNEADLETTLPQDHEADVEARPSDALNWKPAFDDGDDLDGLLAARSPLLSRAFRGERG